MPTLAEAKADLRRRARALRANHVPSAATGERLADVFEAALDVPRGAVVAGYWPLGDEIDVRPLMARLAGRGCDIVLPVVPARGQPLVFRLWREGEPLGRGPVGTSQPLNTAEQRVPAVLIVPLLAFDRSGRRIGYGGGYYDRTLAALRRQAAILAVGAAFALQEIERVPTGAGDERLDWVVTEAEAIRTEGDPKT